jgi:hypothetical protein
MAGPSIEDRISELEKTMAERIARLESQVSRLSHDAAVTTSATPWWKTIVGVFQDDPEFDEAMRLGREYRESLRPAAEDQKPA